MLGRLAEVEIDPEGDGVEVRPTSAALAALGADMAEALRTSFTVREVEVDQESAVLLGANDADA